MTIEAPVNQSHHTDHIDHSDCIDHIVHNNHIEHIDNVNHKDQTISGSSLNKDGKSNATSSKIGMDSNTMFAPASTSAFCQSNPQMANRPDRALAAHFIPIDHATMSDVDHHRHHLKMDDAIAKSAEHRHLFSNVYQDHHRMRIAVLLQRTSGKAHYRNICAISKVASSCEIAEFIFLQESDAIQPPLSEWMLTHRSEVPNDGDDVVISHGDEGFGNMLKRKDIDAVYVVVPPGLEQKYVIQALDAKKHVLVKDPVSTYLGEFVEQLDHAKKQGKFIQFSTMFIHQYRVQRFMDRVLREELFGRINSIEADLLLNVDDLKKVGVSLPLSPQTGCIRSLGRFCILFSVLVFARVDSTATSARVIRYVKGANGELQSATCKIKFTKNREATFKVAYTDFSTRQSIAVHADASIATMEDFVLEHPDGLASYRVYEKGESPAGKQEIRSGEAIDVAGGPMRDTMMWRTFAQLSTIVDNNGWDQKPSSPCQELANVAMTTKLILLALLNSVEMGCKDIPLSSINA